jgi:threonine dehydratase
LQLCPISSTAAFLAAPHAHARPPHSPPPLLQINFPERRGALRRFLQVISPAWNVTLFHYRNTGNRESKVLMGVQVPPAEQAQFDEAVAALAPEFAFAELEPEAQRIFAMFLQ